MERSPPARAGDMGLLPGEGRYHETLRAWELQLLKPALRLQLAFCNKRSHYKKSPLTASREKACVQQQRPRAAKLKTTTNTWTPL